MTLRSPISPRSLLRPSLLALAALAGLSGCSMIPPLQKPAAPVAAAFPNDTTPKGAVAAADIPWQRQFADERLKRLIALALENNRDLRVAVANIEQYRGLYQVKRADELPTVGVGATGTRQPNGNGGITSLYTAGFQVSAFELDFWGRVRSLSQAALAQFLATEEARKTVQISLIASVANTYLALLADDELLRVTQQTLATREDSLRLTKLKFDNGAASEFDFRQAESLQEAAKVVLAQTTRQRMLDENALTLLVGQTLPADLPAGLPVASSQWLTDLPAGLPSDLLDRRPDIRQAEQQMVAANANIGSAKAAFFPRITLTGSVGTASNELSGLFKNGSFAWTFAPQAVLPLFDAGRNQGNLDAARAGLNIATAQYEKAIQVAFREVADALAGRATLGEQVRAQTAQAAAEEARFKLADLRYRNGASSYFDVLDAQRSLFAAQQAVVQAQALQAQNYVTLYRALGGGWTGDATVAAAGTP